MTSYDDLTGPGKFYPPGEGPPPKSEPHRYELWVAGEPNPFWDGRLIFECRDLAELEEIVRTEDLGSRTRPGEVVRVIHAVSGRNLSDFERRFCNRAFRQAGLRRPFRTDAEMRAAAWRPPPGYQAPEPRGIGAAVVLSGDDQWRLRARNGTLGKPFFARRSQP